MAYEIIPKYNWVEFHPLYNPTNGGFDGGHSDFPMVQRSMPRPLVGGSRYCNKKDVKHKGMVQTNEGK